MFTKILLNLLCDLIVRSRDVRV